MLELLQPEVGDKILDVGSGSGRTTALLGHIVGHERHVYGVELILELVELGKKNLAKYPALPVEIRQAGDVLGLPEEGLFDKILVSAEANELPKKLMSQLRIGGTMVIPIHETLWKISKKSSTKKYNPEIRRVFLLTANSQVVIKKLALLCS